MLKGKGLLESTNLFSSDEYRKKWSNNIKIISIIKILSLWIDFKKVGMRRIYYIKCKKYKKIIKPKIYICYKTLLLSSICNKCKSADEKIFMEQEPIEIIQIIGFINNIEKYQNI